VWCPSCLRPDEPHRTLYDSIALALATWPALLLYPMILTAPMVVYLAIRHWKTPSSLIPRSKWRFVGALIMASLQFALIAFFVISIMIALQRNRR
jgi:hypothetical protein